MNCQVAEGLLSAYIDREVSPSDEKKLRFHLAYCPKCAKIYSDLRRTKDLVQLLPYAELPEGFWQSTQVRLYGRPRQIRRARPVSRRVWLGSLAAAVALLVFSLASEAPGFQNVYQSAEEMEAFIRESAGVPFTIVQNSTQDSIPITSTTLRVLHAGTWGSGTSTAADTTTPSATDAGAGLDLRQSYAASPVSLTSYQR